MEDLERCVLNDAIEKVKFFFRLSIRTRIPSSNLLAFFCSLTVLDSLVRLSFALVICERLSDKAEETEIYSLLIKDQFVKPALMPYLVLSDSVLVHVLEQIGIVNFTSCQCQLVDVRQSEELDWWIA